jgi:hypothetical protein
MLNQLVLQDEIFGSAYAAAVYISSVLKLPKDEKVYVIGAEGLEQELASEGISYLGGTVRFSFFPIPPPVMTRSSLQKTAELVTSKLPSLSPIPVSLPCYVVWTLRSHTPNLPKPSFISPGRLPSAREERRRSFL